MWKAPLPLIDLGKKPFFPTLPLEQNVRTPEYLAAFVPINARLQRKELQVLDIRIEKCNHSSASSSMNNPEEISFTVS
jgi:hypothetical protein